jgi:membrane associated rhomboid family serine protease
MGKLRFVIFYLLTGIAAGITQWLASADATIPSVGASGAIAGVLGAYFFLFPRARIILLLPILFIPFFFELPAFTYLLFWFLTQAVSGALAGFVQPDTMGGVAWWAHVGGFAAGVVLHRFLVLPARSAPRRFQRDELGVNGAWSPW